MADHNDPWWIADPSSSDPPPGSNSPSPPETPGPYAGAYATPYGEHTRPAPPRPRRFTAAVVAALLVVVGAMVGAGLTRALWVKTGRTGSAGGIGNAPLFGPGSGGDGQGSGSGGQGSGAQSSQGADVSSLAARVERGVVDVNVSSDVQDTAGAGTGIVLTSNGLVLTNNHVIAGSTRISVTDIGNGRTYAGSVLGYDRAHDVALVQLSGASGLSTAQLGDSSGAHVGQNVVAIGNAGGDGTPSYAAGTLTGLGQQITADDPSDGTSEQLTGMMMTDATIVPGDSGGPLVDDQGRVIGVDTAASSRFRFQAGGNQGFAIPINTAMRIVRQIEAGRSAGTVHVGATAYLGVEVSTGQQVLGGGGSGAVIAQVVDGGPAATAGLAAGDTVTRLDGHAITTPDSLTATMSGEHPGARVTVDYVDASGQSQSTAVVLGSGPPQ